MIITYDTTTFDIERIDADSLDLDVQAANLAYHQATAGVGQNVFVIADDVNVLTNPAIYLVVEVLLVPTSTERKKSIQTTPAASPINLNETTTLAIQLLDKDLNPDPVAGVTVTLHASSGLISPDTFVTNGSGQNPSTITYKPTKVTGNITTLGFTSGATIVATGTGGYIQVSPEFVEITTPTTSAQQNWLESNDIKIGAVTVEKLNGNVNVSPAARNGFNTSIARNVNAVVVDSTFVYVIGYNGPGATNTAVRKTNKNTGENIASTVYVAGAGTAIANGTDGMVDDGTDLWIAAGGDLLQVNKGTLVITNQYVIDATGGSLQFIVDDGTHILSFLRGGTSGDADKLVRIVKATGLVSASRDAFGDLGVSVVDVRYAVILGTNLYFLAGGAPIQSYAFGAKSLTAAFIFTTQTFQDPLEHAITTDGLTIWVGGTAGVVFDPTLIPGGNFGGFASQIDIGTVYSLTYDGTNVWAITSEIGGGPRKYIKELYRYIKYEAISDSMTWNTGTGRVVDISSYDSSGTAPIIPYDIDTDANFIYTGNSQVAEIVGVPKETVTKIRFKD